MLQRGLHRPSSYAQGSRNGLQAHGAALEISLVLGTVRRNPCPGVWVCRAASGGLRGDLDLEPWICRSGSEDQDVWVWRVGYNTTQDNTIQDETAHADSTTLRHTIL